LSSIVYGGGLDERRHDVCADTSSTTLHRAQRHQITNSPPAIKKETPFQILLLEGESAKSLHGAPVCVVAVIWPTLGFATPEARAAALSWLLIEPLINRLIRSFGIAYAIWKPEPIQSAGIRGRGHDRSEWIPRVGKEYGLSTRLAQRPLVHGLGAVSISDRKHIHQVAFEHPR
jgi:hypothetical protein